MKNTPFLLAVALTGLSAPASAITVTLTSGNAAGTSGINSATGWSNGAAPSAGNTYEASTTWLRTPTSSGDFVFAGDSLQLNTGGAILTKNTGAQSLTANLILNGGFVRSGAGYSDTFTLAGTIHITSIGGGIVADQSPFVISADLTGTSGTLVFANSGADVGSSASGPGRVMSYTGTSTFTGDLSVLASAEGGVTFSSTSSWTFGIGASGVNNTITGSGAITYAGTFLFDLTAASSVVGDSWLLSSVTTQTFDSSFAVDGFANQGDGTWTQTIDPSKSYEFDTATGTLSVVAVPEPSVALLGLLGGLGLIRRRR
ncbi:hypothetical protein HNR46_000271 [Haloferula luteola]|uniref:PEP-CTERM protein-sorting domain-containing protein n=1 Tax=Haloferula luteola TaxID=595692 RepID=A0A840V7W8_9BACT|nr:hypothetical protein [Haloferula luteola]MBB5350050.1 hypothetical protein [Haloferula luteola]